MQVSIGVSSVEVLTVTVPFCDNNLFEIWIFCNQILIKNQCLVTGDTVIVVKHVNITNASLFQQSCNLDMDHLLTKMKQSPFDYDVNMDLHSSQ